MPNCQLGILSKLIALTCVGTTMASFTDGSRESHGSLPRDGLLGSESRNLVIYWLDFSRFFQSLVRLIKQPFLEKSDFLISSSEDDILSQS